MRMFARAPKRLAGGRDTETIASMPTGPRPALTIA
jgi:hypothetical protein